MSSRLLIAAALAALPAGTASAQQLRVVAQMADYPADALAANLEGEVSVTLHVAADSSLRCTVDDKTAPKLLQRASCLLVARRWPFGPRLDKKGVPQASDVALRIWWKIFRPVGPPKMSFGGATPISPELWLEYPNTSHSEGTVQVAFDITEHGQARNCVVVLAASSNFLTNSVCPKVVRWGLFLPAVGPDGAPISTRGLITVNFKIPR